MRLAAVALLLAAGTAHAATEQELKDAFAKAQKKGAVAVYEERCGGTNTVYFPNSSTESIAKTATALAALAALRVKDGGSEPCPDGLRSGESRMLELYPDGSVKAR